MAEQMSHWERIRATLQGQETDRVAVSMWRHFHDAETSAKSLAEAMLGFQHRFDWDFMKVNPRASFFAEGWGVEVSHDGNRSRVIKTPVNDPDDWLKLEVLKTGKSVLKEHLEVLELIGQGLKSEAPFVMTIFTPISIAAALAPSRQVFLEHLREHPDKVRHAMEVITETFTDFSKACLERGAAGIFFATNAWGSSRLISEDEYRRFAMPYELSLLKALPPAEFHILHVCGDYNLLDVLKDYPVHAFNWDARGEGNPSLAIGSKLVGGKTVIGGMSKGKHLVEATPQQLTGEVLGLRAAMGKKGWMLSPGCTFPAETPEANVEAVRQAVNVEL